MDESISLNKFISDTGYCSRREADELIKAGRVLLNNHIADTGNRYTPGDVVEVDGSIVTPANKEKKVYIAFNKPAGITTTSEEHIPGNIISYINFPKRIFPVGRLDKDSEGLIFLTNDGDIVNKLLRAGNAHEKEYTVRVHKPLEPGFAEKMSSGIPILDTVTLPAKVQVTGRQSFKLTLTQGLNRQVRRMCEYLGYNVVSLQRTRIMNVRLDKLAAGKWRYLSEPEINELKESVKESSGTAPKKQRAGKSTGIKSVNVSKKQSTGERPSESNRTAYSKTVSKPASKIEFKSSARSVSKPASKAAFKSEFKPASKTTSRTISKPASKAASKPGTKAGNKTGSRSASREKFQKEVRPASKSASAKPARKSRPKPAKASTEKKPIGKYKAFRNKGRQR